MFFESSIVRRPLFALFDESSKRVVSELTGLPRWLVGGLSWIVDSLVLTAYSRGQHLIKVMLCAFTGELEPFALALYLSPGTVVLVLTALVDPTLLSAVMAAYHGLVAVLPLPVAVLVRSASALATCQVFLPKDVPEVGLNAFLALVGALGMWTFEGVW